MSECRRFEQEGLLLLEEGRPLGEHFDTCPDCRTARRSYERLKEELSSIDQGQPVLGWEQRVRDKINKQRPRAHLFWLPAVGAAAAIIAMLLLPPIFQQPGAPSLLAEFQAGTGPVQRGDPTPDLPVPAGTSLILKAMPARARYAEIRVYHNEGAPLFQSSRVASRAHDDALEARVALQRPGRYQAVLFSSSRPIPPPSDSMDNDIAAARQASAQVTMSAPITVR